MAIQGAGVWSIVAMTVSKTLVETAILFFCSAWRPRLRFSFTHCRQLLGFAWPITAQSLWLFVNEELPKVVLGMFLSTQAVGIYSFARRPLELLIQGFLTPLTTVAMPAVSRIQGDREQINRLFNAGIRTAGMIGFPVFIGFAAIAPQAVPLIFGAQWTSAVTAVQLLMLMGLLRTVDSLCALTLLGLGYSKLILRFDIIFTGLAVVLLPVAAQISLEAVMGALVICNLVLVPVFLMVAQRTANVDVLRPLRVFPRLGAATALMFGVVAMFDLGDSISPWAALALQVAVGAAVYCAAVLLWMRADLLLARNVLLKMQS
jgi:O-antigen/teichoic acid export membrane protein